MRSDNFRFAIDRGGTFTDVFCLCPGGKVRVMKLLSVDPANYPDAPGREYGGSWRRRPEW